MNATLSRADREVCHAWMPMQRSAGQVVENLPLRDGVALMLSRIQPDAPRSYRYVEPEAVMAIGMHLIGGSQFDMASQRFATRPLDVWAGVAPAGATSHFTLSPCGFMTVSLRFSPEAARDVIDRHGDAQGELARLVRTGDADVAVARLSALDAAATRIVRSMFSTDYAGTARRLYLESCALGLLAQQLAGSTATDAMPRNSQAAQRRKMQMARECLDARIAAPPSIATLARMVGTNEFTLKRAFKEVFGVTVFGYVRARRMEQAAAELREGCSVEHAARTVGYCCPRSFAEAFRRHFGCLPSDLTHSCAQTPAYHG